MSLLEEGRILVTGGAGFIGSALINALNLRGISNILVSDALGADEKYKNLIPLSFDDYLESDRLLEKLSANDAALSDVRCIFHLGANSSTTEKDCRHLVENNYEYTKALADWALSKNIRFVYASSAATYGDGSEGMSDQDESSIPKLRPLNMYGYSKQMFDLYALRHGFIDEITGLKYFNVFGPNEGHKGDMRSVVHKAYQQIMETGEVSLFKSYLDDYKDGEQLRDFLYVKDAVQMTLHLAESPKGFGLFNLGSGKANTWIALCKGIFDALNKEAKIRFIEMPQSLREKYQYYTCADIAKLRDSGYSQAITPLSDAVADYVQRYLSTGAYLGDE